MKLRLSEVKPLVQKYNTSKRTRQGHTQANAWAPTRAGAPPSLPSPAILWTSQYGEAEVGVFLTPAFFIIWKNAPAIVRE